jgi:hypothetical protein
MKVRKARPKSYANFGEIGRSGLNHWGGEIREEFLRELKGKDGRKVIREMSDNDPIIGAILFAVSMMIRQADPHVRPGIEPKTETVTKTIYTANGKKWKLIKQDPATTAAQSDAEFVQSCFHDMSETWPDVVSEILTMLPHGWALMETVYKKRNGINRDPSQNSRFTDGRIGWRKMPLRAQETLKRWVIDEQGGIQGMVQAITGGKEVTIPIVKALLFRTVHNKNNPEGKSVLRNIYRPWYYKKRIEEIEGIGIERDLAGLPVLVAPEDMDIWNENDPLAVAAKTEAETIVRSIRRDEQEGVLLPFGWELSLLASSGKRNFDTTQVIGRYNNSIAMTMLADFIVLGHNNRYGSMALSSSKTHMFAIALGGWLQSIAGVFNRYAIPRLLEVNGMDIENPPILEFADIELPDLNELGNYIQKLSAAGFQLFPNIPLEKKLLAAASMPTEDMELGRDPMEQARQLAEIEAEANPEPKEEDTDNGSNSPARRAGSGRTEKAERAYRRGRPLRARVAKKHA